MERLCMDRALQAFNLSKEDWGVNVQAYSGSIANLAAFSALLKPSDRILAMSTQSGGQ
jgi:glycine hydroxymethyltransferase